MQKRIAWNKDWFYKPEFRDEDIVCDGQVEGFKSIELPHTNIELPFNGFCEKEYQFISCYKKIFELSEEEKGKEITVEFEGVMIACEIYCNGKLAGEHEGGYLSFMVDLTPYVQYGTSNVLVVKVDSTEREDIPPFGNVVDFLTYGGIYREAHLNFSDGLHIEKIWAACEEPLADDKILKVVCDVYSDKEQKGILKLALKDEEQIVGEATRTVQLEKGCTTCEILLEGLQGIVLWDTENPKLYTVEATVETESTEDIECTKFGFRKAEFTDKGFFLNGKRTPLVGLNRHQSWPYNGYAMPKRIQKKDAEIIKQDLGCNVVRTSHYPQSRHFMDACDELGLLVVEEIPGWQHIGDEKWQEHSCEDVRGMIRRDFNRPSVILWGVRINESQDNHDFYTKTNEIAREMDPYRQTGGTRYIQRSELLEDVYTYNDFTYDGTGDVFRSQKDTTGLEYDVPILVTESNGHMFPTKKFDQESRVVEHAMRHLKVIHEVYKRDDLAGGISWCTFDYNTHSCFGSGDKVCYHGVYDMFRNPKFAAFSYSSQKNPKEGFVLEPVTAASRGERDKGGTVPFYIMTNCDFIRVYRNDELIDDFKPQTEMFPHLEHPPVIVSHLMPQNLDFGMNQEDAKAFREFLLEKVVTGKLLNMAQEDIIYISEKAQKYGLNMKALYGEAVKAAGGWGEQANNFKLEGYYQGKCVCVRYIGEDKHYEQLYVKPDDKQLLVNDESYDATRVVVAALDEHGNIMPFVQECVEVKIYGDVEIMGPSKFVLSGGTSAFWVRTKGETGEVTIEVCGMNHTASCKLLLQKR